MRIGVTGATGFLGRYLVSYLAGQGHRCRCWYRPSSDRGGLEAYRDAIEWVPGELGQSGASRALVEGCDAVVHAALFHPGGRFMGGEGELVPFVETNVVGTIRLVEAARAAGVSRLVFISTCAVHDKILDDRPLDEAHPLWPASHYGAHKAALEAFVHSYGLGQGFPICALRPTGIYGLAHPPRNSKWFDLVGQILRGEPISTPRGGKEVHAADVARAVALLLAADAKAIAGQAYNCYDLYVAEQHVAEIAKEVSGSASPIADLNRGPKNQIDTRKLRALGMTFGGEELLCRTVRELVAAHGRSVGTNPC
jgi:nucleoside-diphosphate-sugar epimerase